MIPSLAFVFLFGVLAAFLCRFARLPRIIGMLVVGILIGPFFANLLDDKILLISSDLRQIALIVILVKAGLSLNLSDLSFKERLFCVVAYLPKATVQAAIGSVPLSLGLACGKTVLSVAVLSILLTAPLGAIGMDVLSSRLLNRNPEMEVQ